MMSDASSSADEDLEAHLRHQVDGVLRAPVDLGVAPLAAEAAGLADGHALDAERLQRALHLVEHVGLDDRGHELHALTPFSASSESVRWAAAAPSAPVERSVPARLPRSYAVSACSTLSTPSSSWSSATRNPIGLLQDEADDAG